MKIQPGYDPEKRCVILSVDMYLLSRYFTNFSGMIKEDPKVPRGTRVEQISDTVAKISFPLDENGVTKMEQSGNMMSIGINAESMEAFQDVINSFISCALKKELSTTEFIPLHGYSHSSLKKDIQEAVKNKRKLCVIKDYSEYEAMSKQRKYMFHQYIIEPGTRDYTEAAILLYNEDMKQLRETFECRLKLESWC